MTSALPQAYRVNLCSHIKSAMYAKQGNHGQRLTKTTKLLLRPKFVTGGRFQYLSYFASEINYLPRPIK